VEHAARSFGPDRTGRARDGEAGSERDPITPRPGLIPAAEPGLVHGTDPTATSMRASGPHRAVSGPTCTVDTLRRVALASSRRGAAAGFSGGAHPHQRPPVGYRWTLSEGSTPLGVPLSRTSG